MAISIAAGAMQPRLHGTRAGFVMPEPLVYR
jgi:hypothetical protein